MDADARRGMQTERGLASRQRALVLALFALVVASILLLLWPTTSSMVEIWQQSSAYGHCYLVIPIALWMAWRESATFSAPLTPSWLGLLVVAAIGFIWLLAELASVAVVTQFAAIGMIVATVLAVFGWTWARRLAFP